MSSKATLVIAEAGVNHNGSTANALELVDVAAAAGADIVKFQTFKSEQLATRRARKADYQASRTGAEESQIAMLKALELPLEFYRTLADHCARRDIRFLSTAFDLDSLEFLRQFDMTVTKIPSGDATAAPLLLEAAREGRPLILSTGMCTMHDIEEALGVLAFGLLDGVSPSRAAFADAFNSKEGQAALTSRVTLLHCVTDYPVPVEQVNLRAMDALRERFGLPVGYSDHTLGISVPLAAVARGATVIEKHFTLDRNLPGPDHAASLEPDELRQLVQGIRDIEAALGEHAKRPTAAEQRNSAVARRSLVALRAIPCGEEFTPDNLGVKRPGTGRRPLDYWDLLGQRSKRSYEADELIDP